jgi:signal transduction histidine kinase
MMRTTEQQTEEATMSRNPRRGTEASLKERQDQDLHESTPEDAYRARLLHTTGLLLCAAGVLFLAPHLFLWIHPAFPSPPPMDIVLEVLVITAGPLTLGFVRSGRIQSAAWTVLGLLLLGSAIGLFAEGRPLTDTAARPSLLLTVALAFVLLERRGAWWVLTASAVILISMHALWWGGYLPRPVSRDRASRIFFSIAAWIVLATILAAVLYHTMKAFRDRAHNLRERVKELTLLHQTSKEITGTLDVDRPLETAVHSLRRDFGYHSVVILTVDQREGIITAQALAGSFTSIVPRGHTQALDEGLIGWAASHVETVLVNDVLADPRYVNYFPEQIHTRSELCVPIRLGDAAVGVLDVQSDHRDAFDDRDVMVLETLAGQIAAAMENARLYQAERAAHQQVRDLVAYLQNAQEEERAHVAREILDDFGQLMTRLQMDLSWLRSRFPSDQPRLTAKVDRMSHVVGESMQVVRRLSSQLRPSILDHFGLEAAIRWQVEAFSERSDIPHQIQVDGEADQLGRELSTALFRILQESLTNVARHAEATEVRVDLHVNHDQATLVVADDGRGITPGEISSPGALGLAGMRERAQAMGGHVTIEGRPGRGTEVTASIPRRRPTSRT